MTFDPEVVSVCPASVGWAGTVVTSWVSSVVWTLAVEGAVVVGAVVGVVGVVDGVVVVVVLSTGIATGRVGIRGGGATSVKTRKNNSCFY